MESSSVNQTEVTAMRLKQTLGSVGFALFYAWSFGGYFGPMLFTPGPHPQGFDFLARFFSLAAYAAAMYVSRHYVRQLLTPRALSRLTPLAIGLGTLIPAAIACSLLGFVVPKWIVLVAWIAFGFACAFFCLLWSSFSCAIEVKRSMSATAASFCVGAAGFFLLSFLQTGAGVIALELTLLASAAIFVYLGRLMDFGTQLGDSSLARLDPMGRATFAVVFDGVIWGLTLCLVVAENPGTRSALIIGGAITLAGLIMTIFTRVSGGVMPTFGAMQRLSFPVVVGGFLAMPFLEEVPRMVCTFAILLVLSCFDISNWGTLAHLGGKYKVQPVEHYSRGRSPILLGDTIGWGLGCLFTFTAMATAVPFAILSLGVVLMLAVAVAVVPSSAHVFTMSGSLSGQEEGRASEGYEEAWRRRCDAVARRAGLSPRESDVFRLLAKGRNSAHIEKALMISGHTVSTHMGHIYRKLDIHTQQELLDLVDSTSPDSNPSSDG